MVVHSEHHEHVRGQTRGYVVDPVIDQHIACYVDLGAVCEVETQSAHGVGKRVELVIALSQRLTVGIGIMDVGVLGFLLSAVGGPV